MEIWISLLRHISRRNLFKRLVFVFVSCYPHLYMNTQKQSLIHQFEPLPVGVTTPLFAAIIVGSILLGFAAGYGATKFTKNPEVLPTSMNVQTNKASGISDKKTFKDSAEGTLREGGVDGEGNFHLERPGGISQNVYLTSSTVDLSKYIGKKVKVQGQTFKGNTAGWLMDVGLVETQ